MISFKINVLYRYCRLIILVQSQFQVSEYLSYLDFTSYHIITISMLLRRTSVTWKGNISTTLGSHVVSIFALIVLIFFMIISVSLLSCHTVLIFSGKTTWEFVSHSRITYLKHFDDDYNPFDEGVLNNMFNFLCRYKVRDWGAVLYKRIQKSNINAEI